MNLDACFYPTKMENVAFQPKIQEFQEVAEDFEPVSGTLQGVGHLWWFGRVTLRNCKSIAWGRGGVREFKIKLK